MSSDVFDLIVIGAGPGGYVAAIRAAQLGMSVAVVERQERLGGVCLNEGCIPSKALLDSSELFALARDRFAGHGIDIPPPQLNLKQMMSRKDEVVHRLTEGIAFLFKKNRIDLFHGTATLRGIGAEGHHGVEVTAPNAHRVLIGKRVLLATGSEPLELPGIPFDSNVVVTSKEALAFSNVPEHLLVVGGGYVGLELGSVWRRLGARVTVVEVLPKLLPAMDRQVADTLIRSLKKQGIIFRLETSVTGIQVKEGMAFVDLSSAGNSETVACDRLLVAAGRRPLIEGLGLKRIGVNLDATGRVAVNSNYETNVHGIHAIGDLIQGPMLAHKAMEEGVVMVERLAGQSSQVDYEYLPGIVYTWPEAASVGKNEEELQKEGIAYAVGRFPFSANGRARCMDEGEGFVKVLAKKESGMVLGIHIVGPRASDMIAEAVTVMTFGGSAQDIAMTFHAHPTLSEALKEAALDLDKAAIHA